MRRVVITGMGLVTPLGCGLSHVWSRLISGDQGIHAIEHFDVSDLACRIAGLVPRTDRVQGDSTPPASPGLFDPDSVLTARERRRIDDFILYAIAAAEEAVQDAGWMPGEDDREARERTGVLVGAGIGGLETVYQASLDLKEKGPRKIGPFTIPSMLINLASGHISIRHGFKGPNHSVVTACATGAHAVGDAARLVALGDADVMLAGGAEAAIGRLGLASFVACRALSTGFNDKPAQASRPYDRDRDGFVMGEGAGVLVLESYEHARARGAKIYAELVGYGLSGDAYHITAPAEDGDGAYRAMEAALRRADMRPSDIDYINAHGTSTPVGDEVELKAVERLFGPASAGLPMSSTKSSIGHLLGAAGAVETIFTCLTLQKGIAPPTLNLDNPSRPTDVDLLAHKAKKGVYKTAMTNSFGFGGSNASLILKTL